jgi:TonB-linked SusC/RagA family outer membrane protein
MLDKKILLSKILFSFVFLCFFNDAFSQNIPIKGRVTDSQGGAGLQGVNITVKGKSEIGTVSEANGNFQINAPAGSVLRITSVNYKPVEVEVAGKEFLNISLSSESSELNEVVVIGYGTRKKRDLTGAISTVDAKDIAKSTAMTPELALQGQVPGVSVISGGGDPSARPTVRIRGVSSFNFSDPLYVIDGIPIEEGGRGATTDATNDPTRRTPINLFTIINPNDIESMTVLKDASATAVYGVRGANGVILITTKSGKKGKVRVDFDGLYGSSKIPKTYSYLNTQEYVKFVTDAYNAHPDPDPSGGNLAIGDAPEFGPVWDPSSPKYLGNSATYDWQNAIQNHSAKIQNYNARVSGASDNTNYNFSVGYANNDGPFLGVNQERYSISTNVNSNIGKYIQTGLNIRLIQEKTKDANFGGITNDLYNFQAAPWQAIYDKANSYGYAPLWVTNQPITPTTFDVSPLWQSTSGPSAAISNYLGLLATNSSPTQHQTFLGSGYVQLQPVTGLKIRGTLSGQELMLNTNGYISFDAWQYGQTPNNPYSGVKNPISGQRYNKVNTDNSSTISINKSLNVDYAHSFGNHHVDVTLDASQEEWEWKTNGASTFITSDNPDLRYFNATGNENGYSELNGHYVLIGYLGRISYNYNSKYYIDVLARRDGSSRFAEGHQWGTFPAASAAWRISKEKFMQDITFINDLKIRGGYGVLGNEQTTPGWKYLSVADVNPPSYNLGNPNINNIGVAFKVAANPDITWEKKRSTNIGFDALLFDQKITLTFDYYHNLTKGIIQSVNLTPSSGVQLPSDINIADVLNRGIEVQAGYNHSIGKIGFSVSGNISTVHNEITALNNHTALRGNTYSLEEGYPIGYLYGYKVGGIFKTQKEIDDWNLSHTDNLSSEQKPGDIYFQDLYGQPTPGSTAHNLTKDSIVNANDQTYLGKTIPGYTYGFTLSANYMGFDVSAFFYGVGDVQKYNAIRAAGESLSSNGRNQFASVLNAWTTDNPSSTMPRAVWGDPNGNNRFSNRFVENADYLRLQNLQIGYTVSAKWLEKTKAIHSFRIYLSGVNLFTITKYSGVDPENDSYPTTRQLLMGVNASF